MRLNLLSFGPPCTGVRGALIALGIIWAFSVLIAIPTAVNFDIIDNNNNHHNNHSNDTDNEVVDDHDDDHHDDDAKEEEDHNEDHHHASNHTDHTHVICESTWNDLNTAVNSLCVLFGSFIVPLVSDSGYARNFNKGGRT